MMHSRENQHHPALKSLLVGQFCGDGDASAAFFP
jgi:hypothetical protein